jgi:hypothetical protein
MKSIFGNWFGNWFGSWFGANSAASAANQNLFLIPHTTVSQRQVISAFQSKLR